MSSLIEYPSLRTQNVYQDAIFSENRDTTRWHASTGVPLRVSSRVGSPARPGERGTPRFLWEGGTDFIIAQNSLEPECVNVIAHPFAERQFGSYCHVAHALAQNKMPYTHTHTPTDAPAGRLKHSQMESGGYIFGMFLTSAPSYSTASMSAVMFVVLSFLCAMKHSHPPSPAKLSVFRFMFRPIDRSSGIWSF